MALSDASNKYKSRIAALEGEVQAREDKLADTYAVESQLRSEVEDLRRARDNLTAINKGLEVEVENARSAHRGAVQEADGHADQLNQLRKEMSEVEHLKEEIASLTAYSKEQDAKVAKMEELETDKISIARDLNRSNDRIRELEEKVELLNAEMNLKQERYQDVVDSKTRMAEDAAVLQGKLNSIELNLQNYEKQNRKLTGELSRANETILAQKKQIIPLEAQETRLREEAASATEKMKKLQAELEASLSMRKSMDPWGFGKEAEQGFARFATQRNNAEVKKEPTFWDSEAEQEVDPLQPPVVKFEQMYNGAAPSKIFAAVRPLPGSPSANFDDFSKVGLVTTRGASTNSSSEHGDRSKLCCNTCGHDPAAPADTTWQQMHPEVSPSVSPHAVAFSVNPSRSSVQGGDAAVDSHSNSRDGGGPKGMFPHVEGAVKDRKSHSAGNKTRVVKSFKEKPYHPSALHAALGSEPFADIPHNSPSHFSSSSSKHSRAGGPEEQRSMMSASLGSGHNRKH